MKEQTFRFGVGMSSYQVEGAFGRSPSIWDELSQRKGAIKDGSDASLADDFYHRYKEDIRLSKELGIQDFRLSFSPTRFFDENGNETVEGIHFYQEVIQEILRNRLRPVVTLYHWDLPCYLEKKGGFTSPEIVSFFTRYAEIVAEHFSSLVSSFITFNEPQCFLGIGYQRRNHAPSTYHTFEEMKRATHHVLLAHAHMYQVLKRANPHCEVSFVNTMNVPLPINDNPLLLEKCRQKLFSIPKDETDFYSISIYLDPLVKGYYPEGFLPDNIKEGDLEFIQISRPDYLGLNIYTGTYFTLDEKNQLVESSHVEKEEASDLFWLKRRPGSLYYGPKFFYERYHLPLVITENGGCYRDNLEEGQIHDTKRVLYLTSYLDALKKAIEDHIDIRGYYYWSLLDNFEWAEGLSKRFGLLYVDYKDNLKRYRKDSFYAYQNIIKHWN